MACEGPGCASGHGGPGWFNVPAGRTSSLLALQLSGDRRPGARSRASSRLARSAGSSGASAPGETSTGGQHEGCQRGGRGEDLLHPAPPSSPIDPDASATDVRRFRFARWPVRAAGVHPSSVARGRSRPGWPHQLAARSAVVTWWSPHRAPVGRPSERTIRGGPPPANHQSGLELLVPSADSPSGCGATSASAPSAAADDTLPARGV
jgi:hypothetical protein